MGESSPLRPVLTPQMIQVEEQFGAPGETIYDLLYRLRYRQAMEIDQVAEFIGVPRGTLTGWLRELGLTAKQISERRAAEGVAANGSGGEG